MGFFSKLFGGEEKPPREPFHLDPVSEMLDEDRYWRLIAESKALSGGDQDLQGEALVKALEKLSPAEIIGFRLRTDKLLFDSYDSRLWCAGHILNGGLPDDDAFRHFRLWLIDQGREVFERAKADPDSLADLKASDPNPYYEFELLIDVADTAFNNKTGEWPFDYVDDDNIPYRGEYPELKFDWHEDDPGSIRAVCPRLMQRFGEQ